MSEYESKFDSIVALNKSPGSKPSSASPKGKRKSGSVSFDEKSKIQDLFSQVKSDPVAEKSMQKKVNELVNKEKKEKTADAAARQETLRLEYIRKHNMYVTDPYLGPILAGASVPMSILAPDVSFAVAQAHYQYVCNSLTQHSSKNVVRKAVSKLNKIVENVSYPFGLNVKTPVSLSDTFDKNIETFEPEISELAIEYSNMFGGAGPLLRFGVKYAMLLESINNLNQSSFVARETLETKEMDIKTPARLI